MIRPTRTEEIYQAAQALPPAAWDAILESECRGDQVLNRAVRSMLEADPATLTTAPALVQPGMRVGRYQVLAPIGDGGFGEVWVAEQREPMIRRVALKVIKLGMDTRQVVARFEAERQALALMDHPNIARVLDAGSTDQGRPYFVMELVDGLPITRFCDRERIDTRGRLDLFMKVCHAVQHAHQKGIIHRDIKPSNVLVMMQDGQPVPKVIDFGIAKATQVRLTDKTIYTHFQQFLGTPAYMSPEQAEAGGVDIDTRSDIYSLGILLYELLTGRPPFATEDLVKAGMDAMRKIIREQEPVKPSTKFQTLEEKERTAVATRRGSSPPRLATLLRGDLDWIILKALEKDRTRRYETASGLAKDVLHYIQNEPVSAAAPNLTYQVKKLVCRHRTAVIFAATIALLLLTGTIVSTWQAIRATRAEATARKEAAQNAEIVRISERLAYLKLDTSLEWSMYTSAWSEYLIHLVHQSSERIGHDQLAMAQIQHTVALWCFLTGELLGSDLNQSNSIPFAKSAHEYAAMAVRSKILLLGDRHPDTLRSQILLAQTEVQNGSQEKALRSLLAITPAERRNLLLSEAVDIYPLLAIPALLTNTDQSSEAASLAQELYGIVLDRFGEASYEANFALHLISLLMLENEDSMEALNELEQISLDRIAALDKASNTSFHATASSLAILLQVYGRKNDPVKQLETMRELERRAMLFTGAANGLSDRISEWKGEIVLKVAQMYREQEAPDKAMELLTEEYPQFQPSGSYNSHSVSFQMADALADLHLAKDNALEAKALYQRYIASASEALGNDHKFTIEAREHLANLENSIRQHSIGESHGREIGSRAVLSYISNRLDSLPVKLIDMTEKYNAVFAWDWHNTRDLGSNLASFESGIHTINGIDFDGRGIVQLASAALDPAKYAGYPSYPVKVLDISIGQFCQNLHFLQGTGWLSADGEEIGHYVIHYENGEDEVVPIIYGKDVRNWQAWNGMNPNDAKPPEPAWTGKQERFIDRPEDNFHVRLYLQTWKNARPEIKIRSVDFVSAMKDSAPFLIAITAE